MEHPIRNTFENWYIEALKSLLSGVNKDDRTGTGTISTTFMSYKHDLRDGYPTMYSRFLKPENPAKEMIWMLSGSKNVKDLQALGVPFWNAFADESGDLGPIYGYLWRNWPNPDGSVTDQIKYVQESLKSNPSSRRMVVSCWNPSFIPDPKRPPKENYKFGHSSLTACHYAWQVVCQPMTIMERVQHAVTSFSLPDEFVDNPIKLITHPNGDAILDQANIPRYFLDLKFDMRSNDFVLGNPANWGMYAFLAELLAFEYNMVARYLCYGGMDVHVYQNHLLGVQQQLNYFEANKEHVLAQRTDIIFNKGTTLDNVTPESFKFIGYAREVAGPAIKFPIAV